MNGITFHRRGALAATVASVALLAGASSASAELPNLGAQLNAGTVTVDVDSDTLQNQSKQVVSGRVAKVQADLRSAHRKLRRAERRLRAIQREAGDSTSRLQQRLTRRVRSLRRSVRRLSRQAMSYAVAEAKSAANGTWLVVSRTGQILEQSGGISVTQLASNQYHVSWSMDHHNCFQLYGGGSIGGLGSLVYIDPVGAGAMTVQVGAASSRGGSGFYLAAVC